MRSSRLTSSLVVLSTVLVLTFAAPVSASTGIFHFQSIGPGAIATWTTAPAEPVSGVTYSDTFLAVFQQLNAPSSRGFFQGALLDRVTYQYDGPGNLIPTSETVSGFSGGDLVASVATNQLLRSASASGTGTLTVCIPTASDVCTAGDDFTFSAKWVGQGPILRTHPQPLVDVTPGQEVHLFFGADVFVRGAAVSPADPFGGALGPLGTLTTASPIFFDTTKLFDAHFGFVEICHGGVPDPFTGTCVPTP